MAFKRPKLRNRDEDVKTFTGPSSAPAAHRERATWKTTTAPPPLSKPAAGKGITTAELGKALGGLYSPPAQSGAGGIAVSDLAVALSEPGASATGGSVESSRVTCYPQDQDMRALPAKAGTRLGPRTTSYRIPLRRNAGSNVYDTVN
jgi:hypothetical protein